jgi:hypothetical protein
MSKRKGADEIRVGDRFQDPATDRTGRVTSVDDVRGDAHHFTCVDGAGHFNVVLVDGEYVRLVN